MTIRSFYRFSARCFVVTLILIFAVSIIGFAVDRPALDNLPFVLRFPLGTLGALCAILFFPFWIGMMWDCIFASKLPLYSKVVWLFFMVFTAYFGLLVYYFAVFERRVSQRARQGNLLHRQ